MKFVIPTTALIGLLLQTELQAASTGSAAAITSTASFTCNEPFMIPAEYIDPQGNNYAMCISDPKFLKNRIIWYIQGLNGSSYKALGVAKRTGSSTFVGKVVPIEEPSAGSGMHADPVDVRVTVDRQDGVISINPKNRGGGLVNWMIRPNGFPSGSLVIPDSCGPFLDTLNDAKLISPLTGSTGASHACILRLPKSDAFISWGWFKHEDISTEALTLESGNEPKFLSVGFVDPDRGVSIDICDRGNDAANRCELSRLVGHTRKSFVVGSTMQGKTSKPFIVKRPRKMNMPPPKQYEIVDAPGDGRQDQETMPKLCPLNQDNQKSRHHKHKQHRRKHHRRNQNNENDNQNELIQKIDMIENNIRSILDRSETSRNEAESIYRPRTNYQDKRNENRDWNPFSHRQRPMERSNQFPRQSDNGRSYPLQKSHAHHSQNSCPMPYKPRHKETHSQCPMPYKPRHKETHSQCPMPYKPRHKETHTSCPMEPIQNQSCPCTEHPHVKQHRVKTCSVQHPLLYPQPQQRPYHPPAPIQAPIPAYNDSNLRMNESRLLNRFRRVHSRLDMLESEINRSEAFISRRLSALDDWLQKGKAAVMASAQEFMEYLAKLKADVVYSPMKRTEKKFIRGVGKVFRKSKEALNHPINYIDNTIVDPIKQNVVRPMMNSSAAASVKSNFMDPIFNATSNVFVDPIQQNSANLTDSIQNNVFNPIKQNVLNPIRENFVDPIQQNVLNPIQQNVLNPIQQSAQQVYDPIANSVNNNLLQPVNNNLVQPIINAPAVQPVNRYNRFDFNDDLLPPVRADLARGPNAATINPLGPVGPVIPPPAPAATSLDQSVQEAIDYLS